MKDHQFSIPQTRLILMGVCLVAMQVLFYAAGVATGVLIGPGSRGNQPVLAKAPALVVPKLEAPKIEPAKAEAGKTAPAVTAENAPAPAPLATAMGTAAGSATGTATATAPTDKAATASAAAEATDKTAAASNSEPEEDDTRVLAIQVASFRTRDGARNFAEVLRRSGFTPVIVGQQDRADETWHYVRLGPYRDWDEAARISAEVDRSYDLHTYIRLVRLSN